MIKKEQMPYVGIIIIIIIIITIIIIIIIIIKTSFLCQYNIAVSH